MIGFIRLNITILKVSFKVIIGVIGAYFIVLKMLFDVIMLLVNSTKISLGIFTKNVRCRKCER